MQKHILLSNSTRSNRRNRRASFAREAVFAEFRARDAKAILDVNFVDRRPDEMPRMPPEYWWRIGARHPF